jgi:chromosome segregation ATPase
MILPKGTVEFHRTGGEDAINDVIGRIKTGNLTGYVLVLGLVENAEGHEEDITGQLVFREGGPVLCESVVTNKSHKGTSGIYHILRAMRSREANIEFKSKIDVEPPIAFFKECKVDDDALNIDDFIERMRKEEEDRQRMEEELKKREEKKGEIQEQVEEWIASGFMIPSFPEIMDNEFDDIEDWFGNISQKIQRINDDIRWLSGIDEIMVEELKAELLELMKKPEDIMAIDSAKAKFQESLESIREKREEIMKWVNLWKDEGYQTLNIEEKMKDDLDTAWNAMTEFMDQIQNLKDARDELENIKNDGYGESYGAEIREIDFLLNDPDEIDNIHRMLEDLRILIEEENKGKENIMNMVSEIADKGFDIGFMKEALNERLNSVKEKFNLLMNNTMRITEIRDELKEMDRRDIPGEIDGFAENTNEPMKLDQYEEKLIELKDKIGGFQEIRAEISSEMMKLENEGIIIKELEDKMEHPIDELKKHKEEFMLKVAELKKLKAKLDQMDNRWLENEFSKVEKALNDPSRLEWIDDKIGRIQEQIDIRENRREKIKKEMSEWETEGFILSKLNDVIEGDLEEFTKVHNEIFGLISGAREILSELEKLDMKYFMDSANTLKARLMDPFELEASKDEFKELEKNIKKDFERRKTLRDRVIELKNEGWSFENIEDIVEEAPELLQDRMEDLETRINKLTDAMKEIDTWDQMESKWLSKGIEELKGHLRKIGEMTSSLDHFNDLKDKVISNKNKREEIKNTLMEWKDVGYIIKDTMDLQDDDIEKLSTSFDDLNQKIGELENIQEEFDSLDTKHFPKEAEDIEFKLNDPALLEDIKAIMKDLKEKIMVDVEKREGFRRKIEDYTDQGFMGAEKLMDFLDEDISIVDLEFKNFAKEVDLFRKYMEKVGFVFKIKPDQKEEGEEQ